MNNTLPEKNLCLCGHEQIHHFPLEYGVCDYGRCICPGFRAAPSPQPEKDVCDGCGAPFEHHHHKHLTREGKFHSSCYEKRYGKTGDQPEKKKIEPLNFKMFDDREFRNKVIMWIADYAYRKANPEGKMNTPSIVYEQVEKDFKNFLKTI